MPSKLSIEEFIARATLRHNGKFDYSKVVYTGSKNRIEIICPIHGSFYQSAECHLKGRGCRHCGNISKSFTTTDFINRAKEKHKDRYDYSIVNYLGFYVHVEIICKRHGSFFQTPSTHLLGSGCSLCNPGTRRVSFQETAWLDYLDIGLEYRQKTVRVGTKYMFVDALKDNIIYEFLGDFWHGNPLQFNSSDINKVTKKSFGELYSTTVGRIKKFEDAGYTVKYIWESEWKLVR